LEKRGKEEGLDEDFAQSVLKKTLDLANEYYLAVNERHRCVAIPIKAHPDRLTRAKRGDQQNLHLNFFPCFICSE